jgi:hypothetical protein
VPTAAPPPACLPPQAAGRAAICACAPLCGNRETPAAAPRRPATKPAAGRRDGEPTRAGGGKQAWLKQTIEHAGSCRCQVSCSRAALVQTDAARADSSGEAAARAHSGPTTPCPTYRQEALDPGLQAAAMLMVLHAHHLPHQAAQKLHILSPAGRQGRARAGSERDWHVWRQLGPWRAPDTVPLCSRYSGCVQGTRCAAALLSRCLLTCPDAGPAGRQRPPACLLHPPPPARSAVGQEV